MIWRRFVAVAFGCLAVFGAARAEGVGPQVDVTLHNGDSTKGQLLSYADGNLTIKLDNGSIVTQDGAAVLALRFLATEKPAAPPLPAPSSQETELTVPEEQRMTMYRRRELGAKNPITGNTPKPLTKEESADYSRLRAKTELHIKALEFEIPRVTTDDAAKEKLNELARSEFLYGLNINEIRPVLHSALLSIKNDELRKKLNAGFDEFWVQFSEAHKKRLEKMREKAMEKNMQNPEIRPAQPQPPDKAAPKPPANSKDAF